MLLWIIADLSSFLTLALAVALLRAILTWSEELQKVDALRSKSIECLGRRRASLLDIRARRKRRVSFAGAIAIGAAVCHLILLIEAGGVSARYASGLAALFVSGTCSLFASRTMIASTRSRTLFQMSAAAAIVALLLPNPFFF